MTGPACVSCAHRTCRAVRATRAPRRFGRSAEYDVEHVRAAAVQRQCPGAVVWWGEESQTYRAMTSRGLHEATSVELILAAAAMDRAPLVPRPAARMLAGVRPATIGAP